MSSRKETIELLRQGLSIPDIAQRRARTVSTIVQHIRMQLGEGQVRPAEIILACPTERRRQLESLLARHGAHTYRTFERHAMNDGFSREEAHLYYDVCRSRAFRGDIYVFIADIEVALHNMVRGVLVAAFGNEESQWWRQGVPANVRKACVQIREDDPEPVEDPFCYTTFINLSDIIDANWNLFSTSFATDKRSLRARLRGLNALRNAVMHPVKMKKFRNAELQALKETHDLIAAIERTRHRPAVPIRKSHGRSVQTTRHPGDVVSRGRVPAGATM